jgi:hypothetical protein
LKTLKGAPRRWCADVLGPQSQGGSAARSYAGCAAGMGIDLTD